MAIDISKCHSCKSCPINITTHEGEMADFYGCLPSYGDAMKWYQETGKVWACHSNNKIPCQGFLIRANEYGIDIIVTPETELITEDHTLDQIYQTSKN